METPKISELLITSIPWVEAKTTEFKDYIEKVTVQSYTTVAIVEPENFTFPIVILRFRDNKKSDLNGLTFKYKEWNISLINVSTPECRVINQIIEIFDTFNGKIFKRMKGELDKLAKICLLDFPFHLLRRDAYHSLQDYAIVEDVNIFEAGSVWKNKIREKRFCVIKVRYIEELIELFFKDQVDISGNEMKIHIDIDMKTVIQIIFGKRKKEFFEIDAVCSSKIYIFKKKQADVGFIEQYSYAKGVGHQGISQVLNPTKIKITESKYIEQIPEYQHKCWNIKFNFLG